MLFPSDQLPKPKIAAVPIGFGFDTLIAGPYGSGAEVALSNRETHLLDMSVAWARRCWNEYRPLRQFFSLCRGRYRRFTFEIPFGSGYLPDERLGYEDIYVGVGDGATTIFDLPVINLPTTIDDDHFSLQTNHVPLVVTTDYTLSMNEFTTPSDFTTWTGFGGGADTITPGQTDPADPPGTDASLLAFSGAGPRGIFLLGSPVLAYEDVLVDIWLRAASGTLPMTVWAQDDGGGSTATTVVLTTSWVNVTARVTALAAANKLMQIGFTGSQTPGNFYAYNARVRPGRDGRAQATYGTAPANGALLTLSGRFCPAPWCRFGSDVLTLTPGVGYVVDVTTPIHEVRLA